MATPMERYEEMKAKVKGKYGSLTPGMAKPKFPGKLSKLSDEALIDLLAQYAEWQAFAGAETGEADADRKFSESALKARRKERMLEVEQEWRDAGKDLKNKKYLIEAEVEQDEEITRLAEKSAMHESAYKLESSYKDAFEQFCFVLSRELTRRLGSEEAHVRKERQGFRSDDSTDSEDSEVFDDWSNME